MKKIKTIIEQMKAAGYEVYRDGSGQICYQKKYRNYFINCVVYYFPRPESNSNRYVFEIQLETPCGCIDVTTVQCFFEKNEYGHPVAKLKDVERLFRKIYNAVNSPKKR